MVRWRRPMNVFFDKSGILRTNNPSFPSYKWGFFSFLWLANHTFISTSEFYTPPPPPLAVQFSAICSYLACEEDTERCSSPPTTWLPKESLRSDATNLVSYMSDLASSPGSLWAGGGEPGTHWSQIRPLFHVVSCHNLSQCVIMILLFT